MITPLDIENKKFSKQMVNGYSVDEVDDFLDELTTDVAKIYKENNEFKDKIRELEDSIVRYKTLESTLNNTLIVAQAAAEEVKNAANKQAEQIINAANIDAKQTLSEIEQQIVIKKKEVSDLQQQMDVYKAKMESLLISQLELLKDVKSE